MAEAQKLKLIDGWEVVIGIEIHTQLATKSKIFSGSSTEFGQAQIHKPALLIWPCRAYCQC